MRDFKKIYQEELADKQYSTFDLKVRWDEMDVNGHINYATYLSYYSEARIEAVGQAEFKALREQGIGPVIYRVELDFVKELFHPDTIHIVTWLDEVISRTRMAIRQRVYSAERGELISHALFHAIFMDVNKRRPVAIPHAVKQRFAHNR